MLVLVYVSMCLTLWSGLGPLTKCSLVHLVITSLMRGNPELEDKSFTVTLLNNAN